MAIATVRTTFNCQAIAEGNRYITYSATPCCFSVEVELLTMIGKLATNGIVFY